MIDGGHRDAFHPNAPDPACPECIRRAEKSAVRSALAELIEPSPTRSAAEYREREIRLRALLASRHLVDSQNRCITCWIFPDGSPPNGHSPSRLAQALLSILEAP